MTGGVPFRMTGGVPFRIRHLVGKALSGPSRRYLAILAPVGAENIGFKGENGTVTQSFGQKVA